MRKTYTFILLFISMSFSSTGQIQWEKLFSGSGTNVLRCVQEVPAGGYIAAGYLSENTANDSDAFVVRLDELGDTLWTFRYNGTLSKKDLLYKVIVTSDGGFVACGYTTSVTGLSDDFLYMKLTSSGQLSWVKTLGGNGKERAQEIIETSTGFTIVGYSTSPPAQYYDAYLVKTDFNGNVLWEKIYGSVDYDDANAIRQLPDGGYILGGQSNNGANGFDQFLIRTDSLGNDIWMKRFGSTMTENIESLILVPDGFVFAGSKNGTITGDDGYIVKTDTAGNILWSNTFGGAFPDDFHRVESTSDGGFILSGTTSSSGPPEPNMWLVKTNNLGNLQWSTTPGGDNHDHGYSAVQTSDGGYIFAGYSGSFGFNFEEGYVIKFGPTGALPNLLSYTTVFAVTSPICAGSPATVSVLIRNFGNEPVSNIPVTVEISGGLTQTLQATYVGVIAPFDQDILTFPTTINTTAGQSYTFDCTVDTTNDVYPANNTYSATIVLQPCTDVEELNARLGFVVYPVPSNGNFSIDFKENYLKAEIELISFTGAVIQRKSISNTMGRVMRMENSISGGIYLLRVTADGISDARTLVVE